MFLSRKKITSDKEFKDYIEMINKDSNLIHYSAHDYIEGFFQFEYIDTSYQVSKTLENKEKVNSLIRKEMERIHPNEFILQEEIAEKGKEHLAKRLILEEILNWKLKFRIIEDVKDSPYERPSYFVSVKYYYDFPEDRPEDDKVENLISNWERTTY